MRRGGASADDLPFRDRDDAGRALAERLVADGAQVDVVLALPRGGVPVAVPVARALHAELDVLVVRKLGVPGHAELAMGAIGAGDVRVLNDDVVQGAGVAAAALARVEAAERRELARREAAYRAGRSPLDLRDRRVLIVDDGLATGATARAAVAVAYAAGATWVGLAVPVAPPDTARELAAQVDGFWALRLPAWFSAVGQAYERFDQVGDDAVRAALAAA